MLKKRLGFILFCLLLSINIGNFSSADTSLDEQTITSCFPEKYCSIKKIHTNSASNKWIIYIQDAHTNYDAQMNINNILKNLNDKNCLDVLLLEGASDLIDTSPIKNYPHDRSKKIVSDYLIQTSMITGFEYFSINSGLGIELFGVEDADIYAKNLFSLRTGINLFQKNSSILDKITSFVNKQKTTITSPELRKFIELRNLYSGNIIDIKEYCLELSQKISFDKNEYPNIFNINQINKLNETINYELLEKEIKESTKFLLTVLEKEKIVEFNQLNLKHKIGSVTARSFYNQVICLLKEKNRDIKLFAALKNYTNLLNRYSQLNHSELLVEIDRIENEFIKKYASTKKEKAIFELENKTKLLEEILSFKVSRKKANRFFAHKNEYTAENFSNLIGLINQSENHLLQSDLKTLVENLNTVTQFYSLAVERDQILVDNSLKKMEQNNMSVGVLIAGGFHTQGIIDYLDKTDINYIFLTPKIKHVSKKNIYISRILKTNSPLDTFFENALNSLAIPRWLAKMPVGISRSDQQVQILKSISLLLTVHTDFLALETPSAPIENILQNINAAIENYDSKGIKIKNIKLFPDYRVYEVSINENSLFYCFKNRQDSSSQAINELIIEDVQAIIARNLSIGDIDLSILTEDALTPILSQRTQALAQLNEGNDTAIIDWAQKNAVISNSDNNLIELNSLPNSIITLSLRGTYYHIEHIRFTGDEKGPEVLYTDKIQASSIKPEYLWHLIQVLQESVQQDTSVLPNIIINNSDYTALVPVNSKTDFISQVNLLIEKDLPADMQKSAASSISPGTEDPSKLNYVKFTTSVEDDESVSDEELIEKLKLFVRDKGPEERLNHIAKTSPNLRILNLLADEKFYDTSGINKGSDEELYILKGLLENPATTKETIEKILNRSYLFILSFREKAGISKTDFIEMLISHQSITSEQLSQITKALIKLKKAVLNDDYEKYENYQFSDEYKATVDIWEPRKSSNLSRINGYIETVIRSPQTNGQTVKLIKDNLDDHNRDTNVYLSLARDSNNPMIIYEEIKNKTYPSSIVGFFHYLNLALAENTNIDVDMLNYLIDTHHSEIMMTLVDTLLNKELTNLSDDQLIDGLLKITNLDPAPIYALKTIAESNIFVADKIYDKLIENNTPDPDSDSLENRQKIQVLKGLASNPNITFTHMYKLFNLENMDIMMSLFSNPSMKFTQFRPEVTLKWLEKMKGQMYADKTFAAMTQNSNDLPEEIQDFLLNCDNFAVRASFATRFKISDKVIEILADDPHPLVRGMIANNPTVPVDFLEKFYEDFDDELVLSQSSVAEILQLSIGAFSKKYILDLIEKKTRILDLLSSNISIIGSPLKLVKPMMNDSRFSENVITSIEQSRKIAVKNFRAKNYAPAFDTLGFLVLYHDYSPFGSTFTYGNIAYMGSKNKKNDDDKQKLLALAKDSYEMSFNKSNNINSFIALEYLNRTGDIPNFVLEAPNHVQFILQNFHSAQPLTKDNFEIINRFLNFSWEDFDYSGESATILALLTHILYDSVSQGFITSETGLAILTQFLYKDLASFTPDKWQNIKTDIIHQIIKKSNLDQSKKNELIDTPLDLAEFYLRKGPRGIVNQQSYASFHQSLLLDNIPPYLRDDVTKSVWLELNGLTQDLLFVEPHFFTLVRMITDNGDFLLSGDRLRFSMNFAESELKDGIGDINSVIKSELGHAISYSTSLDYENYIRHSAFEEFQDRSACLKFPRELEDLEQAEKINKIYTHHDDLLIEFYEEILKKIDPFILMEKLQELELYDINQEYFVRNGLSAIDKLLAKSLTTLDKRYLGEALYVLASENKSIASLSKDTQALFEQLKTLKQEKRELPWDVKVFFEGGIYIQTYLQSFGQLMPPVDLVAGELEPEKLESAEIHFTGEWLNYLFRMRIRDLLRSGMLHPSMLPAFYRSAPIFLNSYLYNAKPNIRHISSIILTLTPKDVFEPIENRSIKETVVQSDLSKGQNEPSAKKEIKTQTAEPEKIVLKLVGQLLQRLYSDNVFSFAQFAGIYTKYFTDVYELRKNEAVIDLSAKTQFTKKFIEHFMLAMADIDIDLKAIVAFLLAQPETEDALAVQDQTKPEPKQKPFAEGSLSMVASEKLSPLIQNTTSSVQKLKQKIVVIDFDEILTSTNVAVKAEMLNALKFNLMLQHKDLKNNLKLMFFSKTKSSDQINSILKDYFSQDEIDRFHLISSNELKKQRTTIIKYLETTYSLTKQNILFITSDQSNLNNQFLAGGALSFEIPQNTTNWFANLFRTFSIAFDFAENERLPQTMNISKVMPVNPNYYDFSFSKRATVTLKQFNSEVKSHSLTLADLSGISLLLPENEDTEKPSVLRKNIFGYDLIEQAL